MKTNKRGISLIILIITIIVMIIIAAAIILNIDDTKIVNKADIAVNKNNTSLAKEIRVVAKSEWRVNEEKLKEEGYKTFAEYFRYKIEEAGLKDVAKVTNEAGLNIIYLDKNGDKYVLPEGFVVSEATGENTVENGLVIYEGNEPVTNENVELAQTTRNQFVWVPVPDMSRFERTTTYKPTNSITAPNSGYTEPYSYDTEITEIKDLTGEYTEYAKMRESVEKYGGFYIARYEAGKEGTSTVVSKKGATVWNYIPWGTSMTEIGTEGAVYRARQMYKGSKSVVSTLCYGVQWDTTLQFIATKDEIYPIDSTGKGNYTGSLLTTGYSEDYAVNNIYDMAGNVREWTMEARSASFRVIRGGCYGDGASGPASHRGIFNPDFTSVNIGFRLTLYIK